ncbi:MAG: hypothetical protein ACFE0Q_14700 [Anaerolineae bacterium]
MSIETEQKWQLGGWLLFVICAMLFIVDSLQHDNFVLLIASILFFVACLFFIVPLIQNMRNVDQ